MTRSSLVALALGAFSLLGSTGASAQTTPSWTVTATDLSDADLKIRSAEQHARRGTAQSPRNLTWMVSGSVSGKRARLSFERLDLANEATDLVAIQNSANQDGNNKTVNEAPRTYEVSEQTLIERAKESPTGGTVTVFVMVFDPIENATDEYTGVARDEWTFEYDLVPPDAPKVVEAIAGERTLSVRWERPTASDLSFYEIRYCPNVSDQAIEASTSTNTDGLPGGEGVVRLEQWPCDEDELEVVESIGQNTLQKTLREGIESLGWVAFAVYGQDESPFLNLTNDDEVEVYAIRTVAQDDFFEAQASGEDGGFCFIATAAHGSYAHPVVVGLRWFRDAVLAKVPGGRWLIGTYYRLSPPLARVIAERPALAAVVRVGLVGFALGLGLGLAFMLWALLRLAGRQLLPLALGAGLMLGLSPTAEAQIRAEADGAVGLGFEFKIGPYRPAMADGAAEGGLPAWDAVYGAGNTRPSFNLGGEVQVYRGFVGTVSIGGSVGLAVWPGNAQRTLEDGTVVEGERGTSTFNLVPMTLTLGYRLDYLQDYTPIPLAPYVRAGLGYSLWWNTRDDGALSRRDINGEEAEAIGGKLGVTGTAGLALSLNALDPRSAASLRASTGVRSSYLFFEGQTTRTFGDGFDLSATTWYGGLMLEL